MSWISFASLGHQKHFLSWNKHCFWNLYLKQVIPVSHFSSQTCLVARCFKISKWSLHFLKFSYARPIFLSITTTANATAGPAMTRVTIHSPAHIVVESKNIMMPTSTICIRSSHICRLTHFNEGNVKIKNSINATFSCSERLQDPIAMSCGELKIRPPRWPLRARQIYLFRKQNSSLNYPFKHWIFYYSWGKERSEVVDKWPSSPASLSSYSLGFEIKRQLEEFNHASTLNHSFSIDLNIPLPCI